MTPGLWFADNSMKSNVVQVSLGGVDIAFVQKIDVLGLCINNRLNFNEHVHRICSKASAHISSLQCLTGWVEYPGRRAIYTSCIASYFKYCPLVCVFTSRQSKHTIDKIRESAIWFVLEDHISNYISSYLLLISGLDSFRIYAVESLMIELYQMYFKNNPYDSRDKCKSIQPM